MERDRTSQRIRIEVDGAQWVRHLPAHPTGLCSTQSRAPKCPGRREECFRSVFGDLVRLARNLSQVRSGAAGYSGEVRRLICGGGLARVYGRASVRP